MEKILFEMRDLGYRDFHLKLIPGTDPETVIGVRVPQLRKLAKKLFEGGDCGEFLESLPHRYYDENMLHALIINEMRDYDDAVIHLDRFLPYVDNWAVCDSLRPRPFAGNREKLLGYIDGLLESEHTYMVRFGLLMLMTHYLNEDYGPEILKRAADIRSNEYYVNMMAAWFFASALAAKWEEAVKYIEGNCLDAWVHNKAIQKSIESRRITDEHKEYLKTMRRR